MTHIQYMLQERSGHSGTWAAARILIVGFYKHLFAQSYSLPQQIIWQRMEKFQVVAVELIHSPASYHTHF